MKKKEIERILNQPLIIKNKDEELNALAHEYCRRT